MKYFDAAATTRVKDEVVTEMLPLFSTIYGNPSSLHSMGLVGHLYLEKSRKTITEKLGIKDSELIFTSGATESNNIAIKSAARWGGFTHRKHIITSTYEHPSVLNVIKELEKDGFDVTYVKPDKTGHISCQDILDNITSETCLVSIMHTNNEIGTTNDIATIGAICHRHGVLFHSDMTQYIGHTDKYMDFSYVDMFSFSGHKFGAPKGIGGLKISKNLLPLMSGGQQEFGLRPGTENVPYIVGMAKALELARPIDKSKVELLKNELATISDVTFNGNSDTSIINISIKGFKGEAVLAHLDSLDIYVSTGSACHSESSEPSHVLKSIGLSDEQANSSVRISLPEDVTDEDVDYLVRAIRVLCSMR